MILTIRLPFPAAELSPNYHGKLRERIVAVRAARNDGYMAAVVALSALAYPDPWYAIRCGPVTAQAHYTYRTKRYVQDDDNAAGRLKAYRDGICQALGLDDADFTWAGPPTWEIGPYISVEVVIREVEREEGRNPGGEDVLVSQPERGEAVHPRQTHRRSVGYPAH